MRRTILAAVTAAALAACGGGDGGGSSATPITCAWFTGPNCWKTVAAAATTCADGLATGTFDAGTTACTYGDGVSVQFSTPASQSYGAADAPWNFSVRAAGGAACATLVETATSLSLTSPAGTFREDVVGSTVFLTCPDGSRSSIDGFAALSCGFAVLPGYGWSESSGLVTYSLLGMETGSEVLWRCGP
jgi:hypothetical protein